MILVCRAVGVEEHQLLCSIRVWLGVGPAAGSVAVDTGQPLGLALSPVLWGGGVA